MKVFRDGDENKKYTDDNRFFLIFAEYTHKYTGLSGAISKSSVTESRRFLDYEKLNEVLAKSAAHYLAETESEFIAWQNIIIKIYSITEISESDYLNWAGLA